MSENNATANFEMNADQCELVISRVFNAPRELVFKVWIDANHLAQWWGPKGWEIRVNKLDLRPGGMFHYRMQTSDGHEMWGKFVYREIVSPERITYINSFSDEQGNTTRAPFSPTWPLEVLYTMTLSENDGKTTLTLRGGPINATEEERQNFIAMFESMKQGFGGTFDQLADYLTKV